MDLFANAPRCALFAKPGMGKTTMVMTFLDHLHNVWGEDAPTLVLGPKRVAQQRVDRRGPEVGAPARAGRCVERHRHADERAPRCGSTRRCTRRTTTTCLAARPLQAPSRAWPFRTVVADESTRLKSFRCGRAASARRRWPSSRTRTSSAGSTSPARRRPTGSRPVGADLVPRRRARLGRTRSAASRALLRVQARQGRADAQARREAGSSCRTRDEQIHEKLADICLTLDPKDWFDLREPVVNVDRGRPAARRAPKYREFERELFMQLDGNDIEAFNAAAKTMKCLQLANGAAYLEDGGLGEVHDAKLEALESLVEENGGEPVLTPTTSRATWRACSRASPTGSTCRPTPAWPPRRRARAGLVRPPGRHGPRRRRPAGALRDVAFFGHWWDLEQHDQFIERVGPMRQLQAGKDRPVFVHYIVARGTVDEVVVERRASKGACKTCTAQLHERQAMMSEAVSTVVRVELAPRCRITTETAASFGMTAKAMRRKIEDGQVARRARSTIATRTATCGST
jgi:hypothetical protein